MLRPFLAVCIFTLLASVTAAQNAAVEISRQQTEQTELLRSDASVFEKAKACQRLAVIGDASSVAAIAPLLYDPQLSVYARTALEQIPGQAADDALVEAVERLRKPAADRAASDGAQRERLLIGVVHSIGRRGSSSAESLLDELAKDEDLSEPVRQIAARTRERFKASDDAATASKTQPELAALIRSGDGGRFRQGLHIARQQGRVASGVLVEQLPSLTPARQTAILIWLGDLGDTSLISQIKPLTQATDDEVAATAWETIGVLGGFADSDAADLTDAAFQAAVQRPVIAPRVLVALASADPAKMNDRVHESIIDLADGKRELEPTVAIGLLEYVVTARLEQTTKPLLQIARSHQDPAVVAAALRAAGSLIPVTNLAELMTVGDGISQRFPDDALVLAAEEAFQRASVRMRPDEVADVIAEQLGTAEGARREKLMERLAYIGGDKALSVVADAARGDQPADVDLATRVLGQWLSTDAANVLGDLAGNLAHPAYRLRSLRGFLRIGRQFDMPEQDRTELAIRGHRLATRPEERLMALEILSRYPSLQGLRWLAEKSDDQAVATDQERRVIKQCLLQVARRVAQDRPQPVADVIRKLDLETFPEPMRAELRELAQRHAERY